MNILVRKMQPIGTSVLAVLFAATAGWAGDFSQDARGTSAAAFLKLPVSARGAALGGAVTALDGEAASLAWNPAGLGGVSGRQVLLGHAPDLEKTAHSNGVYAQATRKGGLGVGFSYFDAGSIDQTEAGTGNTVGSFHPADWSASLGYAHRFGGWALGAVGKVVTTRIVESDQTLAADLGVLSPGFVGGRLRLGAAAKNLGGRLTLGTTSRPLPVEYTLGAAAQLVPAWLVTGDLKFPRDDDPTLAFGTEGRWTPGEDWRLAVRAGWSGTTDAGLGSLAGTAVGLALGFGAVTVDYAYLPMDDLGDSHQVSLGFSF